MIETDKDKIKERKQQRLMINDKAPKVFDAQVQYIP